MPMRMLWTIFSLVAGFCTERADNESVATTAECPLATGCRSRCPTAAGCLPATGYCSNCRPTASGGQHEQQPTTTTAVFAGTA